MGTIISASIDLTKIDKNRIVPGKNGAKYYNIQIFLNDEPDQYQNDVSIAENQTKEERDSKQKKKYLGSGKTIWTSAVAEPKAEKATHNTSTDDLPF